MSDEPIFGRVQEAIRGAAVRSGGVQPTALYLGRLEWDLLGLLCKKWGVDWPPGGPDGYKPDAQRARFQGVPIYCVDAETHLSAS